ncbi:MAG: T9SS type A sorting domain-containing protein [Bacteroidales bacterium]|nr:T9SS type A sorting domain-containing protein [Bacteroidales bacterium]
MKVKLFTTLLLMTLTVSLLWSQNPPQNAPVMTLNVTEGAEITISLLAPVENTEVWVETATGVYSHLIVGSGNNWAAFLPFTAADTIIRIYGNIEAFECKHNGSTIVGLDVSQNPYLRTLWCNENNISHLRVNSEIVSLMAMGNSITELDVSHCPDLSIFYCERNQLQTLDVHANPLLEHISFSQNNISRLDVSNNPYVYGIALFGCNFDACALDSMFYSLADRNDDFSGTIYVQNVDETNPGIWGSKTDVAVEKNWEVQDYNKGNPYDVFGDGNGCNVSTHELQQEFLLNISPNPVKDMMTISIPNLTQNEQATVYDVSGKMVLEQMITNYQTEISLSHLSKGIYIIKIGTVSQKFIKQ